MLGSFENFVNCKLNDCEQGDNLYKSSRVVCIVVALLFFMNQVLGWFDGFVRTDVIGQYGDFVGGVIGTVLSVVLLSDTFKSQIRESKNNAKVFESQQLNELVFHLLNQYNAIIDNYKIKDDGEDGNGVIYKGKEALHFMLVKMQEEFGNTRPHSRKAALSQFQSFYDSNIDITPIYFRTIYRIFDVINEAPVDEDIKVKYAKLIRCQFTDNELVFLRYNAMGQLGKNMRPLINKYNLLKHIHPLDLLEYHEWRKCFPVSSRNKVNTLLYMIQKQIHDLFLSTESTRAITSIMTKYNINVSRLSNATVCKFDFTRNTGITIKYDLFTCFDSLPIDMIKALFVNWLRDVFVFSNFGMFNSSVEIKPSTVERKENKEHFSVTIKRKDNQKIVVSLKSNNVEYNSVIS